MNRRSLLYALAIAAAAARIAMQLVAMPPYAGLDELYHVARLAFVLEEHRQPATSEASIPPYLDATLERKWDAVPSFALLQDQWAKAPPVRDRALHADDLRPYARRNYEAQQPSFYYALVAPLAKLAPRTVLSELRVWRLASALFALIAIAAIAFIGERWIGEIGIAAAALIAFVPTWETLTIRASNDAMACALVACAVAATVRGKGFVAEALLWGTAIAIKLYTWPVAIIVPLVWWQQRGTNQMAAHRRGDTTAQRRSRTAGDVSAMKRTIIVAAVAVIAAALTLHDLSSRTSNPLGVVQFDRNGNPTNAAPKLNVAEIVKVTIASAAWTSGEHWDALKPVAMALYVLPLLLAIAFAKEKRLLPSALCLLAFALAQAVNIVSCILARAPQIGGKEGWYWFVLAPILVPALLAPALGRFRFVAAWIVLWDVVITDCELIPTWSALTSPLHPSFLFRWGPLHLPPAWVIPFRVVQIALLFVVVRRA